MAERFTGQRCQDCQGGLIYNKKEKYWECPYCGKIYERELRFDKVQIDGLAGTNDLVRSTLSKLISLDFNGAEKDLIECEKINHTSIGTLIANISVAIFKSFYIKDRHQELSKANNLLQKLNRDFPDVDEPEEILYDFIDSSDIYALLYVVYSMTNQIRRKEIVFDLLDCEKVYNMNVSKYLLNTLLKEQQIGAADVLVEKFQTKDCRTGILTILKNYPSNPKKAVHIDRMLSKIDPDTDLSKIFDTYFSSSNDEGDVKVEIFLSAISHKVDFNTNIVIQSVLRNCDSVENATRIFNTIGTKRLNENTASAILDWCINKCDDCIIAEIGFKKLYESNSVFEITDQEGIKLLQTEQGEEVKSQKIIQMLNTFKVSSKSMDNLLAFHLVDNFGTYEYRKKLFDYMASKVVSIPLSVIETYALDVSFDGENKHIILEEAFNKSRNISLGTSVASQYLKKSVDSPENREQVIDVFLSLKLVPDPEAVNCYLLNRNELHSNNILDLMIKQNWKAKSNTFDQYIRDLKDYALYNTKIVQVATRFGFVISAQSFVKYLLNIKEHGTQKIDFIKKCYPMCADNVKAMSLKTMINGVEISGNVAQIYLLEGKDDLFVMQEIIKFLQKEKIKLGDPIETMSNQKKVKLRKFIDSNTSCLDKKIETLAQQLL